MSVLFLLSALAIGGILGLLGAGGSILTLPVLEHFAGIPLKLATSYSLIIVGILSAVGAIQSYRQKDIDLKIALIFAVPALIAVYSTRWLLMPLVPEFVIKIFFLALILSSGLKMFFSAKPSLDSKSQPKKIAIIPLYGFFLGMLTGLVGAGGGFIIVPILILLAKLEPKKAVGTSLFVVALNSTAGILGDLQNKIILDPKILISFVAVGGIGLIFGLKLRRKLDARVVQSIFSLFLILMALGLAALELWSLS